MQKTVKLTPKEKRIRKMYNAAQDRLEDARLLFEAVNEFWMYEFHDKKIRSKLAYKLSTLAENMSDGIDNIAIQG